MNVMVHGVDLVEVDRIAEMLAQHGQRFVERCFTASEREFAESAAIRRAERYAVRFACKEAVMKALGTGWRHGVTWLDVSVARESSGQPILELSGKSAELATKMGIQRWQVSLSHTQAMAIASVIGWGNVVRGPSFVV